MWFFRQEKIPIFIFMIFSARKNPFIYFYDFFFAKKNKFIFYRNSLCWKQPLMRMLKKKIAEVKFLVGFIKDFDWEFNLFLNVCFIFCEALFLNYFFVMKFCWFCKILRLILLEWFRIIGQGRARLGLDGSVILLFG